MKKMKRMLIGTLLVFTLCMLTACGNDNNNAADEVQNNANEDAIDKDNVEDGTAEDENMVDDAGDSVNNGADGAGKNRNADYSVVSLVLTRPESTIFSIGTETRSQIRNSPGEHTSKRSTCFIIGLVRKGLAFIA